MTATVPDDTTGATDTAVHLPPATSRGTVVVLTGRGEHPGVYARFGRRLAADGYTVVVPAGSTPALSATAAFAAHPDGLRVLLGSDRGALDACAHAAEHPDRVDALVLAGLPLRPVATAPTDRDAELDLRTACPVHRALLADDPDFGWGRLGEEGTPVPAALPDVPTLLLHGDADRVAPLAEVRPLVAASSSATLAVVGDGVHDVLNDRFHRSVAARIVLFVEELGVAARLRDDVPVARPRSRRATPLHVSARLDYALRAVGALPADPTAEPVRCEAVARARGIPLNSLVNLMVDLRRAGLVRSRRGCEGGYWLARPAGEITVADVVRAVEGDVATVPARTRHADTTVWHDLRDTVGELLARRTLADLEEGPTP